MLDWNQAVLQSTAWMTRPGMGDQRTRITVYRDWREHKGVRVGSRWRKSMAALNGRVRGFSSQLWADGKQATVFIS